MNQYEEICKDMGQRAKTASFELAQLDQETLDSALLAIADAVEAQTDEIMAANELDLEKSVDYNLPRTMIDRLTLTPSRIAQMAEGVRQVAALESPVGSIIETITRPNGLIIEKRSVPFGVIGIIFEARPNVTIDVASLCLKTGNAVILRGGKETQHSNQILVEVVQNALEQAGLPRHAVQAITDPNRELVMQLLKLDRYVDMIIPRGGAGLHELCKQHSTIPVIVGGVGVCHLFVEESADQEKALAVIANAKCQRPSTCNTLETLLVQRSIAETFLPKLAKYLAEKKVKFHAKSTALSILQAANVDVQEVTEQALRQEWGSLDLNVVVVEDMDAAIAHIREYGTQHSESILTENQRLATQFINQVDAAAVYVNASTRFTDGGQFGLGAEVAVSTQKLHARGPMGLEALTSYKWVCVGDYTSRQ